MSAHPIAVEQGASAHLDKPFDQGFTLQGVSVLLGLVIAVLTILGFMRRARRENEADARARTDELKAEMRAHDDTVEKRLGTLEVKAADFMPRHEIERAIEHEKSNRQAADQALKDIVDRNSRDITDIKVEVGKLGQKQDGIASAVVEMKDMIRDLNREVNGKLDKQQECLNSISRRAS